MLPTRDGRKTKANKTNQTKQSISCPQTTLFSWLLLCTTDEVAHLLFCLVYTVHSWSETELRGTWNHFLRPHVHLFSLQCLTTSLEKGLKAEIWVCLENNTYQLSLLNFLFDHNIKVLNVSQELSKAVHSDMFIQLLLIFVHFCNEWDTVGMFGMLTR